MSCVTSIVACLTRQHVARRGAERCAEHGVGNECDVALWQCQQGGCPLRVRDTVIPAGEQIVWTIQIADVM